MITQVTFDQIQIGKQFKVSSGITYQKFSTTESKPVSDAKGKAITNGRTSTAFYNSNFLLTPIN